MRRKNVVPKVRTRKETTPTRRRTGGLKEISQSETIEQWRVLGRYFGSYFEERVGDGKGKG